MENTFFNNLAEKFSGWRAGRKAKKQAAAVNKESEGREMRTMPQKIIFIIALILMIAYAVTLIFPFLWVALNSFKSTGEFFDNFNGLPQTWIFSNYKDAFLNRKVNNYNLLQMLGVTVLLAFGGTLATVATSSMAAYVMAKYDFPAKKIIFNVIIFSMMIPIVGTLPSTLRLLKALQLYNNPLGMIFLYSGGFGMNFLLLYSFFKGVSWGYAEAAYIDGASDLQIFIRIMLPLSKGALSAIFIIQIIGLWNDYSGPAIFLKNMPSLAVGLEYLTTTLKGGSHYPVMFATIMIAITPIVIIFILFSKIIMENTTVGGLKG